VVLGLVVMNFVDGDGGVDDGWLDSLLLDDWLDGLVDVCEMMSVFVIDAYCSRFTYGGGRARRQQLVPQRQCVDPQRPHGGS
jgi:hypothetical protein